jgi:hypothetical protein
MNRNQLSQLIEDNIKKINKKLHPVVVQLPHNSYVMSVFVEISAN